MPIYNPTLANFERVTSSFSRLLTAACVVAFAISPVRAQIVTSETFQNAGTPTNWVFGHSTAPNTTVFDPVSGVTIGTTGTKGLELSNNVTNTATSARFTQTFSASGASVYAEFNFQMYGGTGGTTANRGGDGLTFFLYDGANVNNFQTGAYGGSLGYAQKTGINGMTGGYIGVGLDAYGNFSAASEGRVGGYNNTTNPVTESISVRGPASGGYAYLGGTSANLGTGNSAVTVDSGANPTTTNNTVQILLTATNQLTVTLAQGGATPQTVLQMDLSGYTRPDLLSFGFTAGSGNATDYIFVNGLNVTALAASKWTNASGNGNWASNTNWNPSVVPTNGSDILFDNSTVNTAQTISTGTSRTIRSMAFDAPFNYTVNDNTLTFNNGGVAGFSGIAVTQTHGSAIDTINSAIVLQNDIKVRNNASGTLNLNGTISTGSTAATAKSITFDGTGLNTNVNGAITGYGSVIKNDIGTATFTTGNSYTGGTTINDGTLNANASTALGSGSVVLNGGTLGSTNGTTIGNNLTLSGNAGLSGITSNGNLTQTSANRTLTLTNATQAGTVNLSNNTTNRTLTVEVDSGSSTISGAIVNGGGSTASGLKKTGDGTLVLSGANTYTGTTTITTGTIQLGDNDRLSQSSNVAIDASATLNLNGFSQKINSLTALNGGATIDFGTQDLANTFVFGSYTAPGSGVLVINNWDADADILATTTNQTVSSIYFSGYGIASLGAYTALGGTYGSGYILSSSGGSQVIWDGSSSNIWSTGSNWTTGSRPSSTQIAVFNDVGAARTSVSLDRTRSVGGIQFADGPNSAGPSYTISGSTLTLSGTSISYIQQKSSSLQTISAGLVLGLNTVMDITGSGDLLLSGNISSTNRNLIKDGNGTGKLILSGNNSGMTGSVYINNGIIQARSATALGATTNTVNIAQSSALELSNSGTIANTINATGQGVNGGGAIHNVVGNNTLSGTITQTGVTKITADTGTTLNLNGALTGAGANTVFEGAGNINAAQITNSGDNSVTMNGTGTLAFTGGTANTYTGDTTVNSGILALQKTGSVTAVAGNLIVNGGVARLDAAEQIANDSTVTLAGTGSLNVNGKAETIGQLNSTSATSSVALGAGSLTINAINNQNSTYTGTISGTTASSLNVSGTGKVYLSGNNSGFAGTANVNGGTLNVSGSNSVLGTAAVSVGTAANMQLQGNINLANGITIRGTGTSSNGAIENFAGNNTLSGAITVAAASRIQSDSGTLTLSGTVSAGANALTFSGTGNTTVTGTITGSGTLSKVDSGTLRLQSANSLTGSTVVSGGTLVVAAANAISSAGTLTVSSGANVQLDAGISQIVAGLQTSSGTTINLGANSKLSVTSTTATTLASTLAGTGTLAFSGGGSLTLNSSVNFGGTLAFGGATVGQTPSAVLFLSGTNTLGTLHITGDTILDFGNSTATSLTATNLIIDAGVKVTVRNWANITDKFVALNFPGAVPDQRGTSPVANNSSTQITFTGYSPNNTVWQSFDKQITPAPEPATYGAILVGAAVGLFGFRRLRKRQSPKRA